MNKTLVRPNTEIANLAPETALPEQVIINNDLSGLTSSQRVEYYTSLCRSLGLNPLTRPFQYLELGAGKAKKLTLYATKDCTEQLRKHNKISCAATSRELIGDIYIVTCQVQDPDGRTDFASGAIPIKNVSITVGWEKDRDGNNKPRKETGNLTGEDLANAYMKAETKAKRRATLSICGLGAIDDSEVDSIPNARRVPFDALPEPSVIVEEKPERQPETPRQRALNIMTDLGWLSQDQKPAFTEFKRVCKQYGLDPHEMGLEASQEGCRTPEEATLYIESGNGATTAPVETSTTQAEYNPFDEEVPA